MKAGGINGLRGKHFLLTIFALVCSSIFLWAWEKTPLVTTLISQEEQFKILPPAVNSKRVDEDDGSLDVVGKIESREQQKGQEDLKKQEAGVAEDVFSIAEDVIEGKDNISEQLIAKDGKGWAEKSSFGATNNGTNVVQLEQGTSGAKQQVSVRSFDSGKKNEHLNPSVEKEGCNYAKGQWIADNTRPLYSGFGCKRWLSEMWACRLTQRTDFSYERYRWQPQDCEMPEIVSSAVLRRLQNRTLAFVGDSLGRQQFQSLMCMLTAGRETSEVRDYGRQYGLVKAKGAARPDGWVYQFLKTNTTILYYWSATLCELEPLNISDPFTGYAMHLDRPALFLRKFLSRFDILVLNTGHHWNRGKLQANRWIMYVDGRPNTERALAEIGRAKNFTVHTVVRWLDSQLPKHSKQKIFYRTISPRHFINGDWNTGGSCNNTTPLAGGSEVSQEGSFDLVAQVAVRGTRVKLLDITALSQLRDECHISRYSIRGASGTQDCLHWCLPGVPDTWNEILLAQI